MFFYSLKSPKNLGNAVVRTNCNEKSSARNEKFSARNEKFFHLKEKIAVVLGKKTRRKLLSAGFLLFASTKIIISPMKSKSR